MVFYSALKDLPLRKTVESYGDIGEQMAPVLTGESARRFLEAMEKADRLPRRELPENFFSDIENCLRRSKEQAEKDKSETATVGRHEESGYKTDK